MSLSLSILYWLEEYSLDTRGTRRQQLLASPHAEASTCRNAFVLGLKVAESILMLSRTLLSGLPDNFWDLSIRRRQMRSALHEPADSAQDAPLDALVGPCSGFSNFLVK